MTKRPWNIFFWFWAWAGEIHPVPVPVAYYKFDEWSGDTAFDSVEDYDWTLVNSPEWTDGKINTGIKSDSADSWIRLPDWVNLFNIWWDVSFWFWYQHSETFSSWNWLIDLWIWAASDHLSRNVWIQIAVEDWSNKLILRKWTQDRHSGDNCIRTANSVSTTELSYIVVIISNHNEYSIYINNVEQTLETVWDGLWDDDIVFTDRNDKNSIITSYLNDNWPRLWAGWLIDEVWIWDQALTQEEISDLYNDWDGARPPFS